MIPRMLGLAVVQLNQVVNIVLASFLVVGSLVYLNVAWLLIMSPLVLAMSVSTAVFPTLASESALERRGEVRRLFMHAFRMITFLTVPASVGLIVLGEPLIRLLFERGEFTAEATRATTFALRFYALGLLGHAAVEIVDRVFYAFHDTWTPVRVAVVAIATNLTLSLLLMRTPLGYGGLALANAVAAGGRRCPAFLPALPQAGRGRPNWPRTRGGCRNARPRHRCRARNGGHCRCAERLARPADPKSRHLAASAGAGDLGRRWRSSLLDAGAGAAGRRGPTLWGLIRRRHRPAAR